MVILGWLVLADDAVNFNECWNGFEKPNDLSKAIGGSQWSQLKRHFDDELEMALDMQSEESEIYTAIACIWKRYVTFAESGQRRPKLGEVIAKKKKKRN